MTILDVDGAGLDAEGAERARHAFERIGSYVEG